MLRQRFQLFVIVSALLTSTVSWALADDPYEQEQWKNGYFGTSTYGGPGAGGYYQMSVNLHNGGVNLHIPLLTLPGRAGHDLAIVVSYNSKQVIREYPEWMYNVIEYDWGHKAHFYHEGPTMGRWVINVWPNLKIDGSIYYFTTPDGAVHKLSKYSYPWYIAEDGSDIAYNPSTLKVEYPNGEVFDFSEYDSSYLVHHVDRNGNRITYHFENTGWHRPYKIVDTLGREVLLTYDGLEIIQITIKNHAGQDLIYSFGYDTKLYWPSIADWTGFNWGFEDNPRFYYGRQSVSERPKSEDNGSQGQWRVSWCRLEKRRRRERFLPTIRPRIPGILIPI